MDKKIYFQIKDDNDFNSITCARRENFYTHFHINADEYFVLPEYSIPDDRILFVRKNENEKKIEEVGKLKNRRDLFIMNSILDGLYEEPIRLRKIYGKHCLTLYHQVTTEIRMIKDDFRNFCYLDKIFCNLWIAINGDYHRRCLFPKKYCFLTMRVNSESKEEKITLLKEKQPHAVFINESIYSFFMKEMTKEENVVYNNSESER